MVGLSHPPLPTIIGLLHPSYFNKTKKTNKKRTRHQIKNGMLRQVSPIGKENNANARLKKKTNHEKTYQVTHIHQIFINPYPKKAEQNKD